MFREIERRIGVISNPIPNSEIELYCHFDRIFHSKDCVEGEISHTLVMAIDDCGWGQI
jgi:hypothetical protein